MALVTLKGTGPPRRGCENESARREVNVMPADTEQPGTGRRTRRQSLGTRHPRKHQTNCKAPRGFPPLAADCGRARRETTPAAADRRRQPRAGPPSRSVAFALTSDINKKYKQLQKKGKKLFRFSRISSRQATGFGKEKINIQKIRPGRSAMQWHIKTSFIFLLDKRAPNGPV